MKNVDLFSYKLRAPLLWIIVPLACGIAFSPLVTIAMIPMVFVLFALAAASIVLSSYKQSLVPWKVCFVCASVLFGIIHAEFRIISPPPLINGLPPREVRLTVQTKRIFNSDSNGFFSALVSVENAPEHLSFLRGHTLYVNSRMLPSEAKALISETFSIMGKLTYLCPENATGFDHFLIRHGSIGKINYVREMTMITPSNRFYAFFGSLNSRCEQVLRTFTPEGGKILADIYVGMILGKKQALSSEQKNRFSQSGTFHFFAVSGLHVGVVAFAAAICLSVFKVPGVIRPITGLLFLFCYVGITGFSASAVRAYIMIACYWLAKGINRQAAPFPALVCSATIVLLWQPMQLFDIGFQLSYSVVAMILLFGLPFNTVINGAVTNQLRRSYLGRHTNRWLEPTLLYITGLLSVSISATLASIPLSMLYFSVFSPGAFVLNSFLIIPASGIILLGLLSLFLSGFGCFAFGSFFNYGAFLLAELMNGSITTALGWEFLFHQRAYLHPAFAWVTVLIMFGSLLLGHQKRWKQAYLCLLPVTCLGISLLFTTSL